MHLKVKTAFFYVNDGLVASANPVRLQTKFNTLTGIFEWIGLWENVLKPVGMV